MKMDLKAITGGKGYGLGVMVKLGLPVPPGFNIPTRLCKIFQETGNFA